VVFIAIDHYLYFYQLKKSNNTRTWGEYNYIWRGIMSKSSFSKSKVVRIRDVFFRLCIVLPMALLSLAMQTTSVYAYSSNDNLQTASLDSIEDWSNVNRTSAISEDDLVHVSGENTGAPENVYSNQTLDGVNVSSGGHALAKMSLEPHAYNSSVVVQVYDTDGTPKSGVNVYAFSGSAYSGVSGVSNIYGAVTLNLPDGDYRFRADLNGTQFWSGAGNTCSIPTCTADVVTVSKPVSVTIVDTDGTPKAGLSVYAFDGTTYSGYSKVSDSYGVATFTLPLGDYHFRADLSGTQFWSAEINDCTIPGCESAQVTVSKPVTVIVLDGNGPISGLNVYAFDGTTYSGYHKVSNSYGVATFILPLGDYHFRADMNGTQFWSAETNHCTLPGCENAQVRVSKPIAVTVVDTDGIPKAGLNVYAFNESTYAGYSKVTDASGVATFNLPMGEYRFRADLNGTRFWSADTNHCTLPGCESAQVTVSKPVTVTVMDSNGMSKSGLNIYAFDGNTYTNYSKVTDAAGVATFTLPLGDYRFRADFNGTHYWSDETNHCTLPGCEAVQVTVSQPVTVSVVDSDGTTKAGLNVYAFDGTTYSGYSKVTDTNGEATFTLPIGEYRFRADFNGTQFWSDSVNHCTIPDCTNASVIVTQPVTVTVLDTDGLPQYGLNVYAFDGTVYKNFSKTTNVNGEAIFTLPQGNYHFRADLNGTQFWSSTSNDCSLPGCSTSSVTVTVPVQVVVQDNLGEPYMDVPVYAFNGTTYVNFSKRTNEEGVAILTLPQGDYRFRVDVDGEQIWSSEVNHCTIPGCELVPVVLEAKATLTPTPTTTMTVTPTPTATFTITPTATRTMTMTLTRTNTRTFTPSVTRTRTPTQTKTNTPTRTPTQTITNTPTRTPTLTITNTLTRTSTQTITKTFTPTASITQTPTLTLTPASCAGTGAILRQSWDNIWTPSISALQTDPRYPNFPDEEDYPLSYKGPVNYTDHYGSRYRGYICAPYDDYYRFYVSSDDDSELYLSNSTDPTGMSEIAYVDGWTSNEQWDKYASQRSEWIYLNAGQEYYTEGYHVELSGGDHFTVGWEGLNYLSGDIQVIDGDYLRPYVPEVVPTPQTCENTGAILRQHWDDIPRGLVDDLLAASDYPNNADFFTYETDMYFTDGGNSFGERWRGYICPPYDGEYSIYLASNNQGKVYLSSDANPANMNLVASLPDSDHGYNPYVNTATDFYNYPEQSTTLNLIGGNLYYIEAYWKENTGGQFFNVAWTMPHYSGGPFTIDGEYLVPVVPEPTYTPTITQTATTTLTPTITSTPTATYTPSGTSTITLTPSITGTPTRTYTSTITYTPTRTYTPSRTYTPTLTRTPTRTPTRTLTRTFTPSRTYTESGVVNTDTKTPTATGTSTITLTPTVTFTPTVTYTSTVTVTPTEYIPPTPTNTITLYGGG
jgi:uncharacterized protein GlcG (DUF336 family)